MLSGTGSKKQKREYAGNKRRVAWGDRKGPTDEEARSPQTPRQLTTTGTITTPGAESQRWSMTLRLPRHQATRGRKPEVQSIPPAPLVEHVPDIELENLAEEFEQESKNNHRFDPPMPPEPPPRNVTVGGVPLDPPMDTTDSASTQSDEKEPVPSGPAAGRKEDA
jgi:hypothetical protein